MLRVKIGSEKDVQKYSQFPDYEEFKTNIEIWLFDHQKKFTRGEIFGLNQLIHSSSTIPGVCHKAMKRLMCCTTLDQDEYAISRSTFKRMVRKCVKFGMIKVYETEKSNSAQGGNLYIFQRYPSF